MSPQHRPPTHAWNRDAYGLTDHLDARVTLTSMLAATVRAHPERPALTYERADAAARHARRGHGRGRRQPTPWQTLTWHELAHVVLGVVDRLEEIAGPADTVGILAETDARYPVLELALGLSGRAVQPLYATSPDNELRAALRTTRARTLVVGRSQLTRARSGALHDRIVALDDVVQLPAVRGVDAAPLAADVEPYDAADVLERLARLPVRRVGGPLLYLQSTGTTGPARVVEISEDAVVASVRAVQGETAEFPRFLSFLPPAHISERLLTLYVSMALAGHTWFGGGLATVEADLRACRPTVLLAPPVLLAAIRDATVAEAGASAVGRRLAASVQRTADGILAGGRSGVTRRPLGARLLGAQVRRKVGLTSVRDAFAGTAPLPAALQAWWEALGIPVRNVYGQTEVAGATSMTRLVGDSLYGVGVPSPRVQVRIGRGEELLVRSPSAFTRYVGDEAGTARTLADGWLRTGDRASIGPDGQLTMLGRVQLLVRDKYGATVDLGPVIAGLASRLGTACVAVVPATAAAGTVLYVATEPPPIDGGPADSALSPVPVGDRRWAGLAALLTEVDPDRLISAVALLEGSFGFASGEVGPTGKTRGWRVHALRSEHLRDRDDLSVRLVATPV